MRTRIAFATPIRFLYSFVSKLFRGIPLNPRSPLLENTLAEFRELVDIVLKRYRSAEQRSPVATAALRVLIEIVRQPGIQPSAIAAGLRLHRSTASNLLRELHQHGLIERRLAEGDYRCTEVHPSDAGRALLKRTGIGREGPLEHALNALSEAQLTALGRSMQPVLRVLRSDLSPANTRKSDRGATHGR